MQNPISNDRLGGREIEDTTQCLDGILVLHGKDGEMLGYFRDDDILLRPWEDGWTPLEEEAPRVKAFRGCLPDSVTVIIRREDEVYDYYGCAIAHVSFAPGLRRIQEGMLSENPLLETVVIPAFVEEVDASAFENSTNLRELVIEGDPARVADWAENAFDGEPFYRLRIARARHGRTLVREKPRPDAEREKSIRQLFAGAFPTSICVMCVSWSFAGTADVRRRIIIVDCDSAMLGGVALD